jgi:tetratricopeptide (TPR) repeat protein
MTEHNNQMTIQDRIAGAEAAIKSGRSFQAELLLKQAVDLAQLTFGNNDSELAAVITYLADFYSARNNFEDSEPLYRKALDIYTRTLGPKHVVTAACLHSLGESCEKQGKLSEANTFKAQAQAAFSNR